MKLNTFYTDVSHEREEAESTVKVIEKTAGLSGMNQLVS